MDKQFESEAIPRAVIDSTTFIPYLLGLPQDSSGRLIEGRYGDFAKSIDVGSAISSIIGDVYGTGKKGTVLGDFATNRLRSTGDNSKKYAPDINLPPSNDPTPQTLEQARIIYVEDSIENIKSTHPQYGNQTEVDIYPLINEVMNVGGYVLLGMHEHAADTLLSPPDYLPIIFGNYHDDIRLLRGQMVLCPNLQLLALATHDTPIIDSFIQAQERVMAQSMMISSEEGSIFEENINQLHNAFQTKKAASLAFSALEAIHHQTDNLANPDLQQKLVKIIQEKNDLLQRVDEQINRIHQGGKDQVARFNNSALVGFAHEMRVKMYWSTNRRIFKEFTA